MALTRARPVYRLGGGPGRAGRRSSTSVLRARARPGAGRRRRGADAAEIARHKPPRGPFDIKLGPGGLVDLEFAVQTLQLVHRVGLTPRLGAALAALAEAGLVPPEIDRGACGC